MERKQERIEKPQASSSKPRKVYVLGVAFVAVLLLGASFGIMISATTPSIPTVIEPGSMVSGYSFVIFKDGSTTYARNGSSGALTYSSISSSTVIQNAIDYIAAHSGGKIFFKLANYTLLTTLTISKAHISIDAEPGTVLTSNDLPLLQAIGHDFDNTTANTLNDIQISNLGFYYNGAEKTGRAIYLHKLQNDKIYQGRISFINIKIWTHSVIPIVPESWNEAVPTNPDFVGLCVQDVIGGYFSGVSVSWFGTGIQYDSTWDSTYGCWEQGSHNFYEYATIGYCLRGVQYLKAFTTCEVWDHPKIMLCSEKGWMGSPLEVEIRSPQFESLDFADIALYYGGYQITITNGLFSGIGILAPGYWDICGIYLEYATEIGGATIENCHFYNVKTAIKTQKLTLLIGNWYDSGVTNKVVKISPGNVTTINDGYVLNNRGTAAISASTTVTFYHNMSETPELVLCSFNSTATGAWTWTATSTEITITVVTSGTYTVYWEAKSW